MIVFNCPHCSNQFKVEQSLAGRYGWCRACKGLIAVPSSDGSGGIETLSDGQKVVRIEQLLRYTGNRYEKVVRHLAELARRNQELETRSEKHTALKRALVETTARLEESEKAVGRLTEEVAAAAEARAAETRLSQLAQDMERLREQLDGERASKEEVSASLAALAADPEHAEDARAQLLGEVEQLRRTLEAEQSSKSALEEALQESRERGAELSSELTARMDELAEARSQTDETAQGARVELEKRLQRAEETLREVSSRAERTEAGAAARLQEAQSHLDQLTAEISEVSRNLALAEARAEERARDIERLSAQLEKGHAEEAAAGIGVEQHQSGSPPERDSSSDKKASKEPEGLTLISEIVDDDLSPERGELVDTLLRFIGPE